MKRGRAIVKRGPLMVDDIDAPLPKVSEVEMMKWWTTPLHELKERVPLRKYKAEVIADSIAQGVRLTTLEVTFPRFILAEFNTHRVFSRNSASSRAIPVKNRIAQVEASPFVPESFGRNRAGMQATEDVDDASARVAMDIWLQCANACLLGARALADLGVHKQHANRLIELFSWHTVVVTSTEWANFFALRDHVDAQPEMQETAKVMREALGVIRDGVTTSTPRELTEGQWHLPYADRIAIGERNMIDNVAVSTVHCAAASYDRTNAPRSGDEYTRRHEALLGNGHWSPFEHQAYVASARELKHHALHQWDDASQAFVPKFVGNLRAPWFQYRKMFRNEHAFGAVRGPNVE